VKHVSVNCAALFGCKSSGEYSGIRVFPDFAVRFQDFRDENTAGFRVFPILLYVFRISAMKIQRDSGFSGFRCPFSGFPR